MQCVSLLKAFLHGLGLLCRLNDLSADISVNVANFIIKLYVSFIPSSVAPSRCFGKPPVARSNAHLSLMRSLLPVHGSSCSVKPFFIRYCCHRAHIACFSTALTPACHHACCCKRDKNLTVPALFYICPLYPHLISTESRLSGHQAENGLDFEICL